MRDILPTLTLQVQRGLLKIALDQFPASLVLPRMLPFPVIDTSTGSLETPDAPRSLCTRNTSSVQPNQTGFTYRWLHAWLQSFSVQRPTNCHDSRQFPNFALFTTLLRRVRLSQSVGCKTKYILAQLHAILNCLAQGYRTPSPDAGGPCIPPP
jgi:hypothetical protein